MTLERKVQRDIKWIHGKNPPLTAPLTMVLCFSTDFWIYVLVGMRQALLTWSLQFYLCTSPWKNRQCIDQPWYTQTNFSGWLQDPFSGFCLCSSQSFQILFPEVLLQYHLFSPKLITFLFCPLKTPNILREIRKNLIPLFHLIHSYPTVSLNSGYLYVTYLLSAPIH